MNKVILLSILLSLIIALPAKPVWAAKKTAETSIQAAAKDQADIARIESYLNDLRKISADFAQIDDTGSILRGHISIQRPGKMRVDYDEPNKDFIIADGRSVHIWNDELQEQTNVDQGSSLAEFILRDPVRMDGDVKIKSFHRGSGKLEITLVQTDDLAAGSLMRLFLNASFVMCRQILAKTNAFKILE